MDRRLITGGILGTAVLAGVLVSWYRSLPGLAAVIMIELVWVLAAPCCRHYENVWGFVLFCGTMIPVHVMWVSGLIGLDIYLLLDGDFLYFMLLAGELLAIFHFELITSQYIIALMKKRQVVVRDQKQ